MTLLKNILKGILHIALVFAAMLVLVILLYGPIGVLLKLGAPMWVCVLFYIVEAGTLFGIGNTIIDYRFNKKYGKK